ncbi:MAG: leucyl aminopeptidase [Rhodospirillaceae bacterium]|nr:leucyl aminopeptidase [Rhodospirillaceae bacterium]|tara:strand:- start:28030 stop:29499 length:1470 start_codon:yes stop_codon:yes gene_type:complete
MQIDLATAIPEAADTIVVAVEEGGKLFPAAQKVDEAAGGAVSRALNTGRFKGKKGQMIDILTPEGMAAERIVTVGTGDYSTFRPLDRQCLGGGVGAHLNKVGARHVAVPTSDALNVCDFVHGMKLRSYRFDNYRTKLKDEDRHTVTQVTLVADDLAGAEDKLARLNHVADGVFLTRNLVSEPANTLFPAEFARRAGELSKLGVDVEVLGEAKMAELGMGALLGVGQGSERESQLVTMKWQGGSESDPWLAVVGKGVCFDTGGISLKPGAGMEEMKFDMAGAGCVTGLMHALAARGAKANVVGVIGCVENMPSHNAQRPGDVVTTMSGQTIEVINTDAEGRLVLADALYYTVTTFKPKQVIDLATLTGAVMVALGTYQAGIFSNDDGLVDALVAAGKDTGEELWRLPLGERYDKDINSDIADMKNVGKGREAGSTAGAILLQRFVEGTSWAHLDIAGTAWVKSDEAITPKGATGYGVRLLDRFVSDHYEG